MSQGLQLGWVWECWSRVDVGGAGWVREGRGHRGRGREGVGQIQREHADPNSARELRADRGLTALQHGRHNRARICAMLSQFCGQVVSFATALMRRGVAFQAKRDWQSAKRDAADVLNREPGNKRAKVSSQSE